MTIASHGGRWIGGSDLGIMYRSMDTVPTTNSDVVASRCRHLKIFLNYTDFHNVDEDRMAISLQGGDWVNGSSLGIAHRDMIGAPTDISPAVASRLIYLS